MLKSFLFVSVFSCFLQANVKTANAHVQQNTIDLAALPAHVRKQVMADSLYLVLPEKNNMVIKNKSKYLKGYLVNNTGQAVQIHRADGSLAGVASEVYEKGEWKLYQRSHPVFCGNSYWSQTLGSGKALVIHYDYSPQSQSMVQLRLKWGVIGETLYSNSILVQK